MHLLPLFRPFSKQKTFPLNISMLLKIDFAVKISAFLFGNFVLIVYTYFV